MTTKKKVPTKRDERLQSNAAIETASILADANYNFPVTLDDPADIAIAQRLVRRGYLEKNGLRYRRTPAGHKLLKQLIGRVLVTCFALATVACAPENHYGKGSEKEGHQEAQEGDACVVRCTTTSTNRCDTPKATHCEDSDGGAGNNDAATQGAVDGEVHQDPDAGDLGAAEGGPQGVGLIPGVYDVTLSWSPETPCTPVPMVEHQVWEVFQTAAHSYAVNNETLSAEYGLAPYHQDSYGPLSWQFSPQGTPIKFTETGFDGQLVFNTAKASCPTYYMIAEGVRR